MRAHADELSGPKPHWLSEIYGLGLVSAGLKSWGYPMGPPPLGEKLGYCVLLVVGGTEGGVYGEMCLSLFTHLTCGFPASPDE